MQEEVIPCQFCGEPTDSLGTKCCNACWEVSRRLHYFVKSKNGQLAVLRAIAHDQKGYYRNILDRAIDVCENLPGKPYTPAVTCGGRDLAEILLEQKHVASCVGK